MHTTAHQRGNERLSVAGLCAVTVCIVTYKRDDKLIECLGKLCQSTLQPAQVR
jgi:hypothetical protein